MAFQISLTSESSEIIRSYDPEGIKLEGPYEVGLKHLVFWNTVYNITEDNNVLSLADPSPEPGTTTKPMVDYEVVIEPGYYELDDIIEILHDSPIIKKSSTLISLMKNKLKIKIKSHWQINFNSPRSIGKVLGFSQGRVIKPDKAEFSDQTANITSINTVKIRCNLIRSNIEDFTRHTNILYDFPLDSDKVGGKVIKEPNPICYFKVNTSVIYNLVIKITDQDNKLINFRGEQINLTLDFRPI
jgi:hypothetical protein